MTLMHSKRALAAALTGAAAVLALAGGSAAYATSFAERALPRTTVASHGVGGLDRGEVERLIADLEKKATIEVSLGSQTRTAALADLGVDVDEAATADAVIAASASLPGRFAALVDPQSLPLVVSRDEKRAEAYAADFGAAQGAPPANASVSANAEGVFTATPGARGILVDPAPLERAIDQALDALEPTTATLTATETDPEATTEEATALAERANALVAPKVEVTDGVETYSAAPAEKAAWVKLPTPGEGEPTLDARAVASWVGATAEKTNVAPTPRIDNVDASGAVVVEGARPGATGLKANNVEAVAADLVKKVGAGEDFTGDFDYDEVPAPVETRPVMAGHEGYSYAMAEGEKWIDVNLSTNRLTAYEGQSVVLGPYAINHGSPGHETVTGLYHVYLQYQKQDMGCTPGWPYCARDVPWVSYFTGSYAIHGAPWVSTFGLGSVGGSHGCVNLPVDAAHEVFTWADLGTPVTTHY
ncbi:L,D-transpeptidase family protein [Actinomyces culturomici]|uniref:L,D-transpeptidase family protein n=1 Tax=Actinomyces culturomici TaxID=1926276 RepID=UPI000E1FEDFE|nr:L,D-transpeptidase family protein [Actinomyces culturomici]